jgi:hypothetical protein
MIERDEPITAAVIEAIIRVHQERGPRFLDSVYQYVPALELGSRGLLVNFSAFGPASGA